MKKNKIFTSIGVVISLNILAVSAWFSLYYYLNKQQEKDREMRSEILLAEKKLKYLSFLKSKTEIINEGKSEIDKIFLKSEDIVSFIENLENYSKAMGVSMKISSVNLGEKSSNNPYFEININGDFDGVFKFIVLLENMPHMVGFDRIILSSNGDSSAKSNIWKTDIRLELVTYLPN